MPLQRIIYTSRFARRSTPHQRRGTAAAIAQTSAAENLARQLSGVLAIIDDLFLQVIEGPGDAAEALFESICRDMRHHRIALVDVSPITQRQFGEWSMAFLAQGDATNPPHLDRALDQIAFQVTINAPEAARNLRDLLLPGTASATAPMKIAA